MPEDYRRKYFLREEVLRPCSIDEWLWPWCEDESAYVEILGVEFEDQSGFRTYTGIDPSRMRATAALSGSKIVVIAIFVLSEGTWLASDHEIDSCEVTTAELLNLGWVHLGYDVADIGLISGLSNCSYNPLDKPAIQSKYGPDLNSIGLFRDAETALAFTELSDRRVPEHAPFLRFSLWTPRQDFAPV